MNDKIKKVIQNYAPLLMVAAIAAFVLALVASQVDVGSPNVQIPIKAVETPVAEAQGLDEKICDLSVVECDGKGGEPSVEEQIRAIAVEVDFKWPDYLVRLAKCESKLNPSAKNSKGNKPVSTDRGLFQINSYWQKGVSDECAFDVDCATRWTIDKINIGDQHLWTCDRLI
jgi:hypothetical protein